MLLLHHIWTIARYETKTLLRSWFFRIFAGLTIVILFFLNLGLVSGISGTPWSFRGLSSTIPYMNITLLNMVQSIIAVFLASDFLKRDKKLDTTEVVYMRSMTNGEYVLGKTLGILLVFLALNLVVLAMTAIWNIFSKDASLNPLAYFIYPAVISVPTLVFIFGLSFLLMVLIRNQAVTFVVLLGYIAITLFLLGRKLHYVLDYMAFYFPLIISDFVGFGNLNQVLLQRGMYFLFGLGLIFITILLIKRLPQSHFMRWFASILSIVFIGASFYLAFIYLSNFSTGQKLRQEMMQLNNRFSETPRITITNCDLDVRHLQDEIAVTARIIFANHTANGIDEFIFSINPGLTVYDVVANRGKLKFTKNLHIVTVEPAAILAPGSIDSLAIFYRGNIKEDACYLDIDEETRDKRHHIWLYNIYKRYGFITPDYVLLSAENLWYPVAGIPYGAAYPGLPAKDFINFKLIVHTNPELVAISQGEPGQSNPGEYIFKTNVPLPQLALAIGRYECRSIIVDSVTYSLFTLTNHDYFSSYFNEVGDTLAAIIRESRNDFESRLDLNYPYQRLSLVETPIHYTCYPRVWTGGQEVVQPEIVLLPEKGLNLSGADFREMSKRQERFQNRANETISPQETQSRMVRDFIRPTLLSETSGRRFGDELANFDFNYSISPNYYALVNHFQSDRWPIFNTALESFICENIRNSPPPFVRMWQGLSDEEKANLALKKQSLAEILADPEKKEIVADALRMKSIQLFELIKNEIGEEAFQNFLNQVLVPNRFNNINVTEFVSALDKKFNFNLESYFSTWYSERQLPGFIVQNVKNYKVIDNDRTRFQVIFKVYNPEPVTGLIAVTFRIGRGGPGFFRMGVPDTGPEYIYRLAGGQTKEIGIVLDESPRSMEINTFVSRNIPVTFDQGFQDFEIKEKVTPFHGERVLEQPLQLCAPGEIVVDNEDAGFQVLYQPPESLLKKLFAAHKPEEEDEYTGLWYWGARNRWRATTLTNFYGKFIHSAYYTRSGGGDKKVAWVTQLPSSGQYEVHAYATKIQRPGRGRGRRSEQLVDQLHFYIHHDDGVDEAILDVKNAEEGWNFLGTYYFSEGNVTIELTNKSKGRLVYADAVKWVKR